MNSKLKKRLIWFAGVLVLLIALLFGVNFKLKSKLKAGLQNLSDSIKVDYKDVSLNILTGHLNIKESTVTVYGKTTDSINLKVDFQDLSVSGVSYWSYLVNNKIAVDEIVLSKPQVTYFHNDLVEKSSYNNSFKSSLKQDIEIGSIQVKDGELRMYKASNDSLLLKTEAIQCDIKNLLVVKDTGEPKLSYEGFDVKTGDLFYAMNSFENLRLKTLSLNPEAAKFRAITLNTKYTKEALSTTTNVERDHYGLSIDSLEIAQPKFGFEPDTLFHFKTPLATIHHADFKVFRNKLLPDDMSYKPLYSKALRDLNFKLGIDVFKMRNSSINYIEKVKPDSKGGELAFSELNATIKNIGNIYSGKTAMDIKAVFMKNTPLKVEWDFNINNKNDAFVFKSEIGNLQAEDLNQFTEPNLNVKFKGEFNTMFFTIDGNENSSLTDLKVNYQDFDVIVLKDNGKEKNKLLSAVLNVFISKHSKDNHDVFRYGSSKPVERDKTKSVFNFVWLSLRAALLEAITGNGEKQE
ncbi:hypothetical protein [Algibacter pectinivorans]|nr:hypothetical protein [Algibacter pectinivorans]